MICLCFLGFVNSDFSDSQWCTAMRWHHRVSNRSQKMVQTQTGCIHSFRNRKWIHSFKKCPKSPHPQWEPPQLRKLPQKHRKKTCADNHKLFFLTLDGTTPYFTAGGLIMPAVSSEKRFERETKCQWNTYPARSMTVTHAWSYLKETTDPSVNCMSNEKKRARTEHVGVWGLNLMSCDVWTAATRSAHVRAEDIRSNPKHLKWTVSVDVMSRNYKWTLQRIWERDSISGKDIAGNLAPVQNRFSYM